MPLHKLHPRLQDYVKDNWKGLTPIQEKAFDPIYQGISCTIEAPTSGGKTEAVLFPLLTRMAESKSSGFKVLYIAPLKALLNDLECRVLPYAKMCYREAFKWHGDVSQGDKIQQMLFPSDILLTTPESIEAILLRRSNWVQVFESLETIVIDEAHYFALTERGSHLVSLMERIAAGIKNQPQRIAVTATIGNPHELLTWLTGNPQGSQSIQVENKNPKEKDFKIHFFRDDGIGLHDCLYDLLVRKKSIVFERSRNRTEDTASKINEQNIKRHVKIPVVVRTHHSSVSKRLREDAEISIKQDKESSIDAIISTSTLELGIDIGDLDQIIQIGGLNSSGSFLQRVGRTGRRPNRPQYFRGLCNDESDLILLTGCVNLGLKSISESILLPKRAFHILAHQTICLCLQKRGTTASHIWGILSNVSCFSKVTHEEFNELIKHMVHEGFLKIIDQNILLTGDKTEKEFLRANWKRLFAIFDTGAMYNVVDGKKLIGTLDSDFARSRELPFVFVLGGKEWKSLKIDHEIQQISVQKNDTGIAPEWTAIANGDVPFELAQEVGRLLMNEERLEFLDTLGQQVLQRQRDTYVGLHWQKNKWILESSMENAKIYLWSFAGHKINRTIRTLFLTQIDDDVKYDYMKVVISTEKKDPKSLNDIYNILLSFMTKPHQELEVLIESKLRVAWFSKFSECLPTSLAKKTILEKSMDIPGLVREFRNISIEY